MLWYELKQAAHAEKLSKFLHSDVKDTLLYIMLKVAQPIIGFRGQLLFFFFTQGQVWLDKIFP